MRTPVKASKQNYKKQVLVREIEVMQKTLADNPDAIEEVIEEEISKGNIPTREKILRKARENKAEKDREALKRKAKTY